MYVNLFCFFKYSFNVNMCKLDIVCYFLDYGQILLTIVLYCIHIDMVAHSLSKFNDSFSSF